MYLIWLFCFRQEIESSLVYPNLFRSDEEQLFNTALCVCVGGGGVQARGQCPKTCLYFYFYILQVGEAVLSMNIKNTRITGMCKKKGGLHAKQGTWLTKLPP